jgi:hypothetical protein
VGAIVWYSGPETAWPITEAGIPAVPFGNREALAAALETILSDGIYRRSPAERKGEKLFFMAFKCGTVCCGAKVAQ